MAGRGHVELASRAERDLRRLERRVRGRVVEALLALVEELPPANLDVKVLTGAGAWSRLRVGDYRVLYRHLSSRELEQLDADPRLPGVLVARIVNRRDLDRAVRGLEAIELD